MKNWIRLGNFASICYWSNFERRPVAPITLGIVLTLFASPLGAKEIVVPFSAVPANAPAIVRHINDDFERALREAATKSGGPPGFKYHLVPRGSVEYIGAGPWSKSINGKEVGALGYFFRVHARVKVDVDVFTNPTKVWAVDTFQTHVLVVLPRITRGKIEFAFDHETFGIHTESERQATASNAKDFAESVANNVAERIKEISPKEIALPAALKGIENVISLVITDSGLTAALGGGGDGYALPKFSAESKNKPLQHGPGPVRFADDPLLGFGKANHGTIQFFTDADFKNLLWTVDVADLPFSECFEPPHIKDRVSSVRWRLPYKVLVRMLNNSDCSGNQVTLVGEGEIPSLSKYDFDNNVSRLKRERADSGNVSAGNTVTLYWNTWFSSKKRAPLVVDVTAVASYRIVRLTDLPGGEGWGNEAESVRWDLRPGVIVFLTQNADGSGRNFTLTGNGETANLNDVGLKAKITSLLVLP